MSRTSLSFILLIVFVGGVALLMEDCRPPLPEIFSSTTERPADGDEDTSKPGVIDIQWSKGTGEPGARSGGFTDLEDSTGPDDFVSADAISCRRQVDQAFADGTSGFMVTCPGRVDRVLSDDNEGSRHQRFILAISDSRTLLVAHNIDLAPRAPLKKGDTVTVRGQYEWKRKGGVLHWTHHDPRGRRTGGWVEVAGRQYR